jgi:DNA-nicking Smr family endonuclease
VSKKKKEKGHPFEALESLKKKLAEEEEKRKHAPPAKPAPSARVAKPRATSAEEEALSFHRLVSGVVPLEAKRGRVPRSHALERSRAADLARRVAQGKSAADREADEVHEHLRSLVEGRTRFEVTDDGRRIEGRRVDVTPDVVRKLRRGLLPIDARIDLHGRRAEDARVELETFLATKRSRGERCVLVVHGKGEHSPRGVGVLRGELGAWLSQGRASEHVAAFTTATGEDGGEGATYVLLRR